MQVTLTAALMLMMMSMSLAAERVVVIIKVQSDANELNPLTASGTQDRSLFQAVLGGLDRTGGASCLQICDGAIDNCVDCGEVVQTDAKALYTVLFTGLTDRSLTEVNQALSTPVNNLFGADDVESIDVQIPVTTDTIYSYVYMVTTLQEVATKVPAMVQEVNTILDRTDSICHALCQKDKNICHECDAGAMSDIEELVVMVKGKAKSNSNLMQLSTDLYDKMKALYPDDFKGGYVDFTIKFPRDESSDSSSSSASSSSSGGDAATPPPTNTPLSGNQQVLVIKFQITIELSVLAENSAELARRSTAALGGRGGEGCSKICEVTQNGGEFTVTDQCHQCDGQALVREGTALEAKRWEITLSGRAPVEMDEFTRALTAEVTGYIQSLGGQLNGIAVSSTGEIITITRDSDDGLSGGAIAGIVIGSVVGVALIAALIYFFVCRSPPNQVDNELNTHAAKDGPDSTV